MSPESLLATRQPTKLRVTRRDGARVVLERAALRADTLAGTGHGQGNQPEARIPLAEVQEVATRGFSAGRTVGLGLGVVAAAGALLLVEFAIACRQGTCGY